ncbi:MAG: thioredoxin domain-containing protein [Bacteroidota bacterium]
MKKCGVVFVLLMLFRLAPAQQIQKMKAVELNAYIAKSDKPMVISFWAVWCASCNEEIPYFISTIKEKYNGQVELLLVSLDIRSYYPVKIASFSASRKYDARIVWLNESNADVFCPLIDPGWSGAIPATLMVNNKMQYRKFYETGLSPLQFDRSLKTLLSGGE